MESNEIITIRQLPIIEEHLRTLGEQIDLNISEALSLVCNKETIQSVKKMRTALRNQFEELEERRKAVKKAVMAPYDEFDNLYKDIVASKFKDADAALVGKISAIENTIKARTEAEVREYFDELCAARKIDFISWEQTETNITLSSSQKALRERIKSGIDKICDDLSVIELQPYRDEVMAEYKQNLNLAQAIAHINELHQRAEEEALRRAASQEDRENEERAVEKIKEILSPPSSFEPEAKETVAEEKKASAPAVETDAPVKLLKLCFTVVDTRERLLAIKQFLDEGDYKYE
ncbi:MAG: DUF1351 domain-containing protein [Oscillospiraceae bacterium]